MYFPIDLFRFLLFDFIDLLLTFLQFLLLCDCFLFVVMAVVVGKSHVHDGFFLDFLLQFLLEIFDFLFGVYEIFVVSVVLITLIFVAVVSTKPLMLTIIIPAIIIPIISSIKIAMLL